MSQTCTFVGFLISFTAFNILYNLLSSPQCLQPGHGEEEPPGSCPARQRGTCTRLTRDVGTNSLIGTARKTLGTTSLCRVCIYVGDQLFFLFPFAPEVAAAPGRSGRLRLLAPGPGCFSSRIAMTQACWSHRTPSVFPLNLPQGSIASFIFTWGRAGVAACSHMPGSTNVHMDCSLKMYILLTEGSFHSTGQALGEGRGLPAPGFASKYGWEGMFCIHSISLRGISAPAVPCRIPAGSMARDGVRGHGHQPPSLDPWGHSCL